MDNTYADYLSERDDQLSGELDAHNESCAKLGLEPMTLEEYLDHR